MKLVIAEKPSVAQSIARVIGARERKDGYLEGNGYLVSWCIGHLVELSAPEHYDESYSKWRLSDLPILPEKWHYEVSLGTRKQFNILKSLMEQPDVVSLVCATDAGREGELIFRLVYSQCRCKKPFERLWISSMEDAAIQEGFRNLKPGTAFDNLYEAALCRERADWIVGMNATRLFSCLYGTTLAVGRVMTPTLGLAVMREAEIRAFKPETFYEVELHFSGISAKSERIKNQPEAEELLKSCLSESHIQVLSAEHREKNEKPPALYDLTSLQRDANRILGFTAQQTLDYTQSLYEKKLVTYPRTDSRYLTDDMATVLPEWLNGTANAFGITGFCMNLDNRDQQRQIAQVINSSKVSDHHAIIPTRTCAEADLTELPSGEMQILRLIACRFLAAVGEPHRYAEMKITLSCGGQTFTAKGREEIFEGWRQIEKHFRQASKKPMDEKEAQILPVVSEGQEVPIENAQIKEGQTSPPKRFTEDTMLSSMESAGAKDMPEDAERKGLGTPATRAATIEKLVQKGFIERRGDKKTKYLVPTDRGISLITVIPEIIQSPSLTADWEQRLLLIERGQYDPEAFMREIEEMISSLISTYEVVKGADVLMAGKKVMGTCPHCGAEVIERQKGWFCSNRQCRFVLWKDNGYFTKIGKRLTGQMVERLLRDRRIRLKDCRSRKTGKTYNADLLLFTEDDGRAVFSMEFDRGGGRHERKKPT